MRALTNGEGEEEERAATAEAAPRQGRKRRRAEQRGAQRARGSADKGAGRAKGPLRPDPTAQPGQAVLRAFVPVPGAGAGAARRSPSPTVKVVSRVDSPVGGAERADDVSSRHDRFRDQAEQSRSVRLSPHPPPGGSRIPGPGPLASSRSVSPGRAPRSDSSSREAARLTLGPGARVKPSPQRSGALGEGASGGQQGSGQSREEVEARGRRQERQGQGPEVEGEGQASFDAGVAGAPLFPASEEEGAPTAQLKERPTACASGRASTSYADAAQAANSGAHTLASLAPELSSGVRQCPCTQGKHTRKKWDAADSPHVGITSEVLLPWSRGLYSAASVRAMLAKAAKPVVCWLVLQCATSKCWFQDQQLHKSPDAEPTALPAEALKNWLLDVSEFPAGCNGPLVLTYWDDVMRQSGGFLSGEEVGAVEEV